MLDIRDALREFIVDNFLFGQPDPALTDEASLFENGIMNSTGVLELVAFIEDRFGMSVDDGDLVQENFGSINGICDYIARKSPEVSHG